jgi:acetyl-CoA synthetase
MPEFAPSVLPPVRDYDALCREFRWQLPASFNIAVAVCDRWAEREPRRVAILYQHADRRLDKIDYGTLRETSNRLANALRAHGIARGDRVALLPQMPEVAAIHIAIYAWRDALPLAALFAGCDLLPAGEPVPP